MMRPIVEKEDKAAKNDELVPIMNDGPMKAVKSEPVVAAPKRVQRQRRHRRRKSKLLRITTNKKKKTSTSASSERTASTRAYPIEADDPDEHEVEDVW